MHTLAQRVLSHIRQHQLLKPGDRVGAAVSGGIDSVALVRLLLELRGELGIVLVVVHFNHRLRGAEAESDVQFVSELARVHELEFLCDSADVSEYASQHGISLEAGARELRYGFFQALLTAESTSEAGASDSPAGNRSAGTAPPLSEQGLIRVTKLDKIITGHTLDDQAETVLMRMIRGTGLTGLSGIHPRISVENDEGELCGEIVRPMLGIRRCELERYLNEIGQNWREDSTNADHTFTRNRLRHLVLPLLEKEFNPAIAESLAELAEIARGEEEYWDNEVAGWMGTAVHWIEPDWAKQAAPETALIQISASACHSPALSRNSELQARIDSAEWLVANASVSLPWFLSEPTAVQRRVVKAIGEHAGIALEFKHTEEILRFAAAERSSGKELSLPMGWKVQRHPAELLFVSPDLRAPATPPEYQYELCVPGRTVIPQLRTVIEAQRIPANSTAAYNPDELLDADSLPGPLKVRNWRAGDRFWPAHTKSPKKIKELLQELHIAQPERGLWPLVQSGNEIVWVRGFAVHAAYRPQVDRGAIVIRERSLTISEQ